MILGRILLVLWVQGTCLTITPWIAQAGEPPQPSTTDRMVRDTRDAFEATKQYTLQQKETFQQTVQVELNELQIKIAELRKRASAASVEARGELQKAIQELEKKKDAARRKLEELHASTSSAWSIMRDGMTAAVEDLKKSYKEAVSKLP